MFFRSLKKADLLKYVGTHYKAPRMVLAAAGGVNHDQLVRLSEEHFGSLKSGYQGEVPDLLPLPVNHFVGASRWTLTVGFF